MNNSLNLFKHYLNNVGIPKKLTYFTLLSPYDFEFIGERLTCSSVGRVARQRWEGSGFESTMTKITVLFPYLQDIISYKASFSETMLLTLIDSSITMEIGKNADRKYHNLQNVKNIMMSVQCRK